MSERTEIIKEGREIEMVSNHPSTPQNALSTLPNELLTAIIIHLDQPASLALALVARRFTQLCEQRIWREVNLTLNPHYGERPRVLSRPPSVWDPSAGEDEEDSVRAEEERRAGLRKKVAKILMEGNSRRMGYVEKVVAVPRPGAIPGIVTLLDMVSPNLRGLRLSAPASRHFEPKWRAANSETLDVRFLDVKICFECLTHLRIENGAIRFDDFVVRLCRASPSLVSLYADVYGPDVGGDDTAVSPYNPRDLLGKLPTTKLRQLWLAFGICVFDWEPEDFPLLAILKRSPLLEQVSIDFTHDRLSDWSPITRVVGQLQHLRDLYVTCDITQFYDDLRSMNREDKHTMYFPCVRRLGLYTSVTLEFLTYTPCLPSLELLILEQVDDIIPRRPARSDFPESSPSPPVLPQLANILHGNPRLRRLHHILQIEDHSQVDIFARMDEIESAGSFTGHIRSLHHGSEELIHAHLLLPYLEPDGRSPYTPIPFGSQYTQPIAPNTGYPRGYDVVDDECVWQDFVTYDGYTVPMHVLLQMRLAAKVGSAEWAGRGVEVGEKAWRVLKKWRRAQGAVRDGEGGWDTASESQDDDRED